jgi:hypothetical protein
VDWNVTQQDLNPRHQFGRLERLVEVVIGAERSEFFIHIEVLPKKWT